MRLILIRHGETEANLLNRWSGSKDLAITNLTASGKAQAQKLGDWFRKENFTPTHVYVSPQKRAKDTLKIILKILNINTDIVEAWELNERHYGELTGLN